MPKNDFDIVEEESEEESEEDSIEEESINEEAQEDINISLPSMLHEGLPTPPFKATSSNEYDMVYNEILLRSLRQEDYNLSQQEYVNYGKVEEEIAGLVEGLDETATTPTPTINSNNDNIATLQESISHKLSIIHTLKSDLTYLTPLMAQNQGTSSRLTAQRLPLLTRLQQEYYAKYKLLRDKTANTAKNKRRYRQRAGPWLWAIVLYCVPLSSMQVPQSGNEAPYLARSFPYCPACAIVVAVAIVVSASQWPCEIFRFEQSPIKYTTISWQRESNVPGQFCYANKVFKQGLILYFQLFCLLLSQTNKYTNIQTQ